MTTQQRQVDLGREDELVPWSAWFQRASAALAQFHPLGETQKPIFRVTLIDGRVFAITHVQTHVSRGKCFVGTNRWGEQDAVCDVITGYTLAGRAGDGRPTALVIPPAMIASVECVAIDAMPDPAAVANGKKDDGSDQPFGFAAYREWDGDLTVHEVDETEAKNGGAGYQNPGIG